MGTAACQRLPCGSPDGPQGWPRGLGRPGFSACPCRFWDWGGCVGGVGIAWIEDVWGSRASAHRSERDRHCKDGRAGALSPPFLWVKVIYRERQGWLE